MAYIQKNKTFRNLILKFYNKKCSITEEVQISNLQDIHIIYISGANNADNVPRFKVDWSVNNKYKELNKYTKLF